MEEATEGQGGSRIWVWVLGGLAVLCGGGVVSILVCMGAVVSIGNNLERTFDEVAAEIEAQEVERTEEAQEDEAPPPAEDAAPEPEDVDAED